MAACSLAADAACADSRTGQEACGIQDSTIRFKSSFAPAKDAPKMRWTFLNACVILAGVPKDAQLGGLRFWRDRPDQ
jgi:hypothetical protein